MGTRIKRSQKHAAQKSAAPSVSAGRFAALQLACEGIRLITQGSPEHAEKAWRQALQMDPECALAWTYLTDFLALKCSPEATFALDRLIQVSEKTAQNCYAFADKACFVGRYSLAQKLLDEASALKPSAELAAKVRLLMLTVDRGERRWLSAIKGATEILESDPGNLELISFRESCYYDLGWSPEDVADCRRYIEIKPGQDWHNRLLVKLNYLADTTPELLHQESRKWSHLYAAPLVAEILPHKNNPTPSRRLKVGYVSTDIKPNHPMLKLLPGVFRNHNRNQFEIFLYAIGASKEASEQIENLVDHFIDLPLLRDPIVQRVRQDEIDILIDLPHRTMETNAYLAFAAKPAPVQCSWMGILATTGLSTMDYFIGDQRLPCPGTEHLFSETVYRLPRIHSCYQPLADPGIVTPPFFKNGHITFGSFNDPRKITRDLVKVWSVILHLHPTSKLLLKYTFLNFADGQSRFLKWFSEDGICRDRLIFEGLSPAFDYYAAYNKMDIHLDSFPYNGGTTTLDALWMGVPVVAISGRTTVSSCAACILPEVDLPVASTFEQYISLAAQFAKAIPHAPDIRHKLREKMLKSNIMDQRGLVVALEAAYRDMWQIWCANHR